MFLLIAPLILIQNFKIFKNNGVYLLKFFSKMLSLLNPKMPPKIRDFCGRIFLIGARSKKLLQFWLLILRCWFLIGPLYDQEFSYILIEVNPSAFQNGMALEKNFRVQSLVMLRNHFRNNTAKTLHQPNIWITEV